jgi:opacity protein-like surface antigen
LRRSLLVLAVAVLPLSTGPALCGEPIGTAASGGYSFAKLADVDRHGGSLALDFDLAGPVAAFVDGSLHHGRDGALAQDDLTLMAGPGLRVGRRGGVVLFARGLAGLVRDAASVDVLDVSVSEKSSHFGFMAGGGVDVHLAGRWAVRAQGDYLWWNDPDGHSSGLRLATGVVYRFGARP